MIAPPIRPARAGDVATIAALLTDAIATDPLAQRLVPDPAERQHVYHGLLAMEIDHAVEWGHVDVTLDMTAVAVWQHHPPARAAPLSDYHLSTFTGRALPRFQQLHTLLRPYRSGAPHHWLARLHVLTPARRQGLGRALLAHHHQRVDQLGYPIDTVTTTTVRDFLTRQGYHAGTPVLLHGEPQLWPLRRAGRPVPLTTAAG
ncbi:GNAT family N-acetyltransferase [Verrucosispora sp. WMMD1129]|uniref:GNAT family N-acetyltransferase n=1 Tax=Verrucosispora sp. WMMD1129 TaxID=3016093 RepID=UPI00249A8EFB|nr:GNAT family N-acetyltransferase [Verrucosispora sp. WMMD1129]WFE47595.1 GNAT family N-acetyltransferase [Verrucosispora sp. WMMD1129]